MLSIAATKGSRALHNISRLNSTTACNNNSGGIQVTAIVFVQTRVLTATQTAGAENDPEFRV
jgi:hypothetical protein